MITSLEGTKIGARERVDSATDAINKMTKNPFFEVKNTLFFGFIFDSFGSVFSKSAVYGDIAAITQSTFTNDVSLGR